MSVQNFISASVNLPEIISKIFQQPINIFKRVQCRQNYFEIISADEIILFQFQTWIHVKYNTEIIQNYFKIILFHT